MNEQQQELNERIADDERIATVARKAYDYDALAARLEVLESAFDNSHQLNEQLGDENRALLARVAELEAQLAAQQWRPVTEDWPPYGVQHLGRAMLNSPTLLVTRTTDDSDEVWQDNDGMLFYGDEIRYCAVIPESPPLFAYRDRARTPLDTGNGKVATGSRSCSRDRARPLRWSASNVRRMLRRQVALSERYPLDAIAAPSRRPGVFAMTRPTP